MIWIGTVSLRFTLSQFQAFICRIWTCYSIILSEIVAPVLSPEILGNNFRNPGSTSSIKSINMDCDSSCYLRLALNEVDLTQDLNKQTIWHQSTVMVFFFGNSLLWIAVIFNLFLFKGEVVTLENGTMKKNNECSQSNTCTVPSSMIRGREVAPLTMT